MPDTHISLRHALSESKNKAQHCMTALPATVNITKLGYISIHQQRTIEQTSTQSTAMSSSDCQANMAEKNTQTNMAEYDVQSTRSTSTMASTKSLLKSMWRSKRTSSASHTAETTEQKSQKKLKEAEARAAWAMSR
ncbi:hypothetical protein P171DRAFT_427290 [Karstenula rhodostoma CBS 690.94]|uniref:Uncharacterized protein n=1 Tax=Karstenula rhodostoma CBS 690.94 TaxID=1392251 RepID=A0A9P4PY82_9PLEO|nr:hypothetical protein P171DRAFT_427290 [Karstenula rhodostoma CBS 690.94]